MKHPVCWFLSSVLIASTSLCFSLAAEEILTSENSFNGNNGTNATFIPWSTNNSAGTIYRCIGDISIAYAGKGTPLTTSCFTEATGDLTFLGSWCKLCFENISPDTGNPKPAAIEVSTADKTLLISGFSLFSCSYCPPSPGSAAQAAGAIKSAGAVKFENTANVLFKKNQSKDEGGAINCKTFSLTGVTGTANFIDNQSTKNGGALYTTGATTISNNNNIIFSKNNNSGSTVSGGAIDCTDATNNNAELKLENNKKLIFSGNKTGNNGGAIYADKLTITSGGPTLFANNYVIHNSSPKGGAICLKDTHGECSLTANLGDITFIGNTIVTNQTPARNSIDLGSGGKFTQLRAKDGFGIFFYDPVTSSGTQTTKLTINQADGNAIYTGRIVFSGEKLTDEERKVANNLKSTLIQETSLNSGSLILKNGVTLEAKSFTQTTGSSVIMDLGTTLQTPSADGDNITLTNLYINVASLGNGGVATPAKITATTTGKKVVINSVGFVDDNGNGYDYPILATDKPFTGIEVTAATASTPDIPAENLTNYVPPAHYGYQGNWTVTWTGTGVTKTATLIWNKTGYVASPERRGTLVPNTLWGAFSDVRAIQNLIEVNANGANYPRGFWVAGLANFLHKSGTATKLRFRHDSAGYLLGVFNQTASGDIFSAAFGQLFGRDKDYLVSKNTANIYTGSIYYQHTSSLAAWERLLTRALGLQVPLVLDAQLTYSHSSNEIKTNAPGTVPPEDTIYSQVKGDWKNDCIAVELGATAPIELSYAFFDTYAPFMKVQFVYAHQEDFKERNNDRGRHFENSHLTNLSLPIGIRYEKSAKNNHSSYNLTLTYVPDIVRSNPNCTISLLSNPTGAIWTTTATNLARQAFVVRAGNYKSLSKNFEIFSQFSFELRDSSRTYNVDLGSKIRF
ncbi:Polymorphic membrane protein F,chlamydial polymorphic outer membrane protein repeat,Autotransporter beta-domain [Chlamydia poikilotherma]|uniref:Polymorphic membrane protein F,chlamydial polymorphic outer membrane protein repeat,Autotransporter beta-domain n=1 Tax=Chlamydia poikilotherma TaxID=1967783 RepID=A0A3B0QFY2_9CHLA|nr:autotransporter domain-containing protein [Chlamydia poikilotherma]SYX08772.1 Polymorphic membrane protein F,chlamydial polymorphic outer membrane protein repeat,Autotransporter beta-domain [Chlamydia poikilotherma]